MKRIKITIDNVVDDIYASCICASEVFFTVFVLLASKLIVYGSIPSVFYLFFNLPTRF